MKIYRSFKDQEERYTDAVSTLELEVLHGGDYYAHKLVKLTISPYEGEPLSFELKQEDVFILGALLQHAGVTILDCIEE